jgi:hypothetical protein
MSGPGIRLTPPFAAMAIDFRDLTTPYCRRAILFRPLDLVSKGGGRVHRCATFGDFRTPLKDPATFIGFKVIEEDK